MKSLELSQNEVLSYRKDPRSLLLDKKGHKLRPGTKRCCSKEEGWLLVGIQGSIIPDTIEATF